MGEPGPLGAQVEGFFFPLTPRLGEIARPIAWSEVATGLIDDLGGDL